MEVSETENAELLHPWQTQECEIALGILDRFTVAIGRALSEAFARAHVPAGPSTTLAVSIAEAGSAEVAAWGGVDLARDFTIRAEVDGLAQPIGGVGRRVAADAIPRVVSIAALLSVACRGSLVAACAREAYDPSGTAIARIAPPAGGAGT